MEYELNDNLSFTDEVHELSRSTKVSKRQIYESNKAETVSLNDKKFGREISQIHQKYGDLENMRQTLKCSRREICEYLMVDASAWSRWTSGDRITAPPHVYRTMALIMEQKLSNLSTGPLESRKQKKALQEDGLRDEYLRNEYLAQEYLPQIDALKEKLEITIKQNEKYEILTMGWKIILILNSILLFYVLFR